MKKIWQWVKRLFFRSREKHSTKRATDRPDGMFSGSWRLADLIEELPRYHAKLEKMDKYRLSGIAPAMRMGPTIIPGGDDVWLIEDPKDGIWQNLPSQFFVSFLDVRAHKRLKSDGKLAPLFFVGMKVKRPYNVAPESGACYQFLMYFDEIDFWASGHFWVDVKRVSLARERTVGYMTIPQSRRKHMPPVRVPQISWKSGIAQLYEGVDVGVNDILTTLFSSALNWWSERKDRWLVVTKRAGRRVSFSVEEGRHLYFFRDRDKIVTTPTGQRKRIFHIVSEHDRRTASGKVVTIKEHCRGIRHFLWHDTECHIFSPGWHGHDFFSNFEGEMITLEEGEDMSGTLPAYQVSEKMARVLEGTNAR